MSKREKVTSGQVAEMTDWLRRLTPEEYQARRGLLRKATDPKQAMDAKFLYPFTDQRPVEEGWRGVEREGALCDGVIDISKLEVVSFHKDGETYVPGEEMMKRAADEKKFPGCQGWGQHAAEHPLSRANELPTEWANNWGPVLIFTDTVLVDDRSDRCVPYLFWRGGRWQLGWVCLEHLFRRYRFVRLRK